jgi:hypothetical protein
VAALTPGGAEGITPAYTETPITPGPTATLDPSITPTATVCTYWAGFVDDVTIPDGTEIVAGTVFEKTWRLRSNGCLNWLTGTALVFHSGDSMDGPASVPVTIPALGGTTDVSVSLTAPDTPGEYTGYWQLQAPDGTRFGPTVYVQITAVEPPPDPTAPDLEIRWATWMPDPPVAWEDMSLTVRVKNIGDAPSEASTLHVVFDGLDVTLDIPALAPDARHDAQTAFNAPAPGTHTLTLTVDAGDENDEHNEDNNTLTEDITTYRVTVRNWGGAVIGLNECMDLDGGGILLGCANTEVDFRWRSEGAAGSTYHTLQWQNGAVGGIHGATEPDYLLCTTVSRTADDIDGGRTITLTGDVEPADLPVGVWLCYHTSEGLYGAFEVSSRTPFTINYINWELSDS